MSKEIDIAQRIAVTAAAALQRLRDGDLPIDVLPDYDAVVEGVIQMQHTHMKKLHDTAAAAQRITQAAKYRATYLDGYKREFSDHEFTVPEDLFPVLIEHGFIDQSWHNDACPSFTQEGLLIRIWVHDAATHPRYAVQRTDADLNPLPGSGMELTCSTPDEVVAAILAFTVELATAIKKEMAQ